MNTVNDRTPSEFSWPIRVYWEDTDAGGIVFYANYLKYFERARTEWLRSLGLGQQTLRESLGAQFVVSEVTVRYHRPARLDDELRVTARLRELGRASLTLAQRAELVPRSDARPAPVPCCEAVVRIGWVDTDTLRPARLPAPILDVLKP